MIDIMDFALNRIGIIEDVDSLKTTELYCNCGSFEFECPLKGEKVQLLRPDNLINIDGYTGVIEYISYNDNYEGAAIVKVVGRELKSILDRRIIWNTLIKRDTVEKYLRTVINDSFINPINAQRKISIIKLGQLNNVDDIIEKQVTGDNVLDLCKETCSTYDVGFDLAINNHAVEFTVYKGKEKNVIFSSEFDNVATQDLTVDYSDFKNTCLVAGEDKDVNRVRISVEAGAGLERREIYVDARDLQKEEGVTDSQYKLFLTQRGKEKLQEHPKINVFDCETIETNFKYGIDFGLGDIVTISNNMFCYQKKERIYGVERIYQGGSRTTNLIFGKE